MSKKKKSKSVAEQPKTKSKIWLKVLKCFGLAVVVCLLVIFGIYLFFDKITDQQSDDATDDMVAFFNVIHDNDHCYIDLLQGENSYNDHQTFFSIDTGSAMSQITPATLDFLREKGYAIDERFAPSIGYDALGNLDLRTKIYQISFPQKGGIAHLHTGDSTRSLETKSVTIKKVRFALGRSNLLGADFLNKYSVEICHNRRYMILHKNNPSGYETKIELKRFDWKLGDIGGRYLWVFPMNGHSHKFFVDTGRGNLPIQLPHKDYKGDKPLVHIFTVITSYANGGKEIWGVVDTDSIVIGDHHIVSSVYYLEGDYKSPYSVNPLQMYERRGQLNEAFDILFDLGHNAMFLR